jgi:hypothetical protein
MWQRMSQLFWCDCTTCCLVPVYHQHRCRGSIPNPPTSLPTTRTPPPPTWSSVSLQKSSPFYNAPQHSNQIEGEFKLYMRILFLFLSLSFILYLCFPCLARSLFYSAVVFFLWVWRIVSHNSVLRSCKKIKNKWTINRNQIVRLTL